MSKWLYDCPIEKISNSIIGGGTPSRNISSYWNGDIPWASVKDFTDEKILLQNIQEKISIQGLKNSAANLIKPNFPIICFRMAVGRVGYSDEPIAINQDLKAIDLKENIHNLFFIYLISSLRSNLESIAIGSTVKGITLKQFLKYKVNIPSDYSEQKKIADILFSIDKVIETTERTIEKYKAIKQGMLEDLFTRGVDNNGKVRPAPSEAPELYKLSELGFIPKDWEVDYLSKICHINPSYVIANISMEDEVAFIKMEDVSNDAIITNLQNRTLKEVYKKGFTTFIENDILMAKITPCMENGKGCLAQNLRNGIGFGSTEFNVLRPIDNKSINFIYHLTCYKYFRLKAEAKMTGSAGQKRVTTDFFEKYKIGIPSLGEQFIIGEKLNRMNSQIANEEKKLSKFKSIKQGLMSDLLSGKKQVKI